MTDITDGKRRQYARSKKQIFAPIPCRALCDPRLSRSQLLMLGIIAAHDRFSANGRGCDVSRKKLSELAGINIATFSSAIRNLEAFGYIIVEPHQADGRRRVYRVIYTNDDKVLFNQERNQKALDQSPGDNRLGRQQTTNQNRLGRPGKSETPEIIENSPPNIFPERENICPERENTFARMRASLARDGYSHRSTASHCCEIERKWRNGQISSKQALDLLDELDTQADEPEEINHIERIHSDILMANPDDNSKQ